MGLPPVVADTGPDGGSSAIGGRLTLIENGLEALANRLDDTEDAIATTMETVGGAVADLRADLDRLLSRERSFVEPRRWAARATKEQWNDLVDWVDHLNSDYSLLSDYAIPPCWPAHPGVVEELAGIWRAWIQAVIGDASAKKHGSADLAAWHDRWFWPCLERIKAGHYRTTNCRQKHQQERFTVPRTDRTALPRS